MRIKKIFNNNAIVFINKDGQEEIGLGKGIGYQKRIGDNVDESLISKIFILKDKNNSKKLEELLNDIPVEYIELATDIIRKAQDSLKVQFSETLFISLSDHIFSTINRLNEGIVIKNDLLWEIRRFYPDEYKMSEYALALINAKFNTQLPQDEAGFIAMHLINTEIANSGAGDVNQITCIIQDVSNIVRRFFHIEFDISSVYYYRFMTHLKFFSERMLKGRGYDDKNELDNDLLEVLKDKYYSSYKCVELICDYLKKNYGYITSDEEVTYLIIHIQRIVYKTKNAN